MLPGHLCWRTGTRLAKIGRQKNTNNGNVKSPKGRCEHGRPEYPQGMEKDIDSRMWIEDVTGIVSHDNGEGKKL